MTALPSEKTKWKSTAPQVKWKTQASHDPWKENILLEQTFQPAILTIQEAKESVLKQGLGCSVLGVLNMKLINSQRRLQQTMWSFLLQKIF